MRTRHALPAAVLALLSCTPRTGAPTKPWSLSPTAPPASTSAAPPATARAPMSPEDLAKLDALIARYVDARGGLDAIHALKSLRLTGTVRLGGSSPIEAAFGMVAARGKIRTEVSFQGMTGVDAFDGKDSWSTEPWAGRRDPFRVPADESKSLLREADLEGPLVDWRAKGHYVEYLGAEQIDGTMAHKLRVELKDGDVEYHYLDPDAMLEIRVLTEARVRGTLHVTEKNLGDYEKVSGVYVPFAIESGGKGEPPSFRVHVERAEANVDVDDAVFALPAPGTKVAKTIAAGSAPPPAPTRAPSPASAASAPSLDRGILAGIGARNIGSSKMSGRVAAVAAFNSEGKTTVYVGAASGGVWRSLDGGTTFTPVFDHQAVQSIGAITIDPSRTSTIWVGTGEAWTRNSASIGDGIYKSTNAGATWTNMGLRESERIARVVVHPRNGDVVYACATGKLWSDSADRGVYKTTDGGKTWSLVLKGSNLSTGCSGLAMDPKNPDVLFAGLWDFRRKGWTFRSGGDGPDAPSGSGLYRTSDGGKTWTQITSAENKGIPAPPWGRVEVATTSDSKIVYALIESKDSALYRSDDGGVTWEARDKSQNMVWRPFYFARLVVDPTNPERVFKPDLSLIVSDDGGKSFLRTGGGAHGDWHDLWIDPQNTKHIIGGDDGGLWTSWDGGTRWWKSDNLPISQFYHVSVDAKDPYQVYGGLQDNSSWVGDSAYPGGITSARWENLYQGDGFYTIVDPTDPEAVYAESQGGNVARVDRRTHTARDIQPQPGFKEKLRFNWNTPIYASPTQKGTIYIGAQFLFRSRDRGDTWERISPDLTTNDPQKQKQEQSGGVTVDNSSAEMHTTVYTISESPLDPKVLWVGTDDGSLQLSRDSGRTWNSVTSKVPGLPPSSWVSWVEASRFDAGTAYAAFDRHTFGDMTPWVFRTTDYGATWTRIVAPDQGVRGYAHVIKEDTVKRDLLFLGTELGLWISIDRGARWAEFKGGDFPAVAVRDLAVHPRDGDLVVATHGRGIWIVDDLSPLRALTPEVLAQPSAFLPGRPAQQRMMGHGGWAEGDQAFEGANPATGVVLTYYARARHVFGPIKLEVLDASGKTIDTISASRRRGFNRVVWGMRVKPPRVPLAAQVAFRATRGPRVVPGTYTFRLTDGDRVLETKVDIGLDRRAPFTVADRRADFDAAMRAHALFGDMSALVDRIDLARKNAAPDAARALDEAKKKIVATKEGGAITGEERIREHLDQLYGALVDWEGRPARYQLDRLDSLKKELDEVSKEVDGILQKTGVVPAPPKG